MDALEGVSAAKAAEIADTAGFPADVRDQVVDVLQRLWEVFTAEDATLVEVNPLVRTPDGSVVALDGKVTLDDNAAFRHPGHAELVDTAATDPLEQRAKEKDLNYVKLHGEVGIIGNGAGLVMSTLDVVAYAGEEYGGVKPANFLDIGGGASAQVMADGLEIILSDPEVRSVLVNVFGGITACDEVANGIVQALAMLADRGDPVTKPLVVRLDGNNADEGRGHPGRRRSAGRGAGRHDGRCRPQGGRARRVRGGLTQDCREGRPRWRSSSPRSRACSCRASPGPRAASTPGACSRAARRSWPA